MLQSSLELVSRVRALPPGVMDIEKFFKGASRWFVIVTSTPVDSPLRIGFIKIASDKRVPFAIAVLRTSDREPIVDKRNSESAQLGLLFSQSVAKSLSLLGVQAVVLRVMIMRAVKVIDPKIFWDFDKLAMSPVKI